jgi:hypothetical protein
MGAPIDLNKYYELKASGLRSTPIEDPSKIAELYPPLPQGLTLRDIQTTGRNWVTLPVAIEFPKEWRSTDRLNWYNSNGFTDNGMPTGQWKKNIESAYANFGFKRKGNRWYTPNRGAGLDDPGSFIPLIIASDLEKAQNPNTSFATYERADGQKLYDNISLDLTNSANVQWGRAHGFRLPGNEYDNYLLPNNQAIGDFISQTEHRFLQAGPFTYNPESNFTDSILRMADEPPVQPTQGVPTPELPFSIAEPSGMEQITERPLLEGGTSIDPVTGELIPGIVGKDAQEQFRREFGYKEQNRDVVKQFLMAPSPQGYNIKGIDEGLIEFDFEMDQNGNLTQLDVYKVTDGVRDEFKQFGIDKDTNERFNAFKRTALTQDLTKPTDEGLPSGTFPATGAWAVPGFPQTGISGVPPTGTGVTAPGFPTMGNLDQSLRTSMTPAQVAAGLQATLPGSDVAAIRGLYAQPLSYAQTAYNLDVLRGAFQPPITMGIGKQPSAGGFGFQQYLSGQPNYMQSLQQGLQAINQVKQKIQSGISPDQLVGAEKNIYDTYIGGTESDPFKGARAERDLRDNLTNLLPYQLRDAASRNVMNLYNRQLNTPSNLIGMPGGMINYGQSTNPFMGRNPMQMQAPTAQAPTAQAPTVNVSATAPVDMDAGVPKTGASVTNNMITGTDSPINAPTIQTKSTTGGTSRESYKGGLNEKGEPITNAMVQRDANGNIIQIYDIIKGKKTTYYDNTINSPADLIGKIVSTDINIAGADAQKAASDLQAKMEKDYKQKTSFTGAPGSRFPTGTPRTDVPKVFGDVSKYTKAPSPAPTETPKYQGQKNLSADYMDFITGGRSGTTPISTMENIGAADMPQGLGVSAMEGRGLGSPTMKVASPMYAPPGVVGSRVSGDVGRIGALVPSPYANQFTGPTQMIPENIPMPPPPRVDSLTYNSSLMEGLGLGSPTRQFYQAGSQPNALAMQAEYARLKLKEDFEKGKLNFPMKRPFELEGIGLVPEWYAPQYNRIVMR